MPKKEMTSGVNAAMWSVVSVVGAGLIMAAIATFQGHASQEDLDTVEAESKVRDQELEERQNDLVDQWTKALLSDMKVKTDIQADLRHIKEKLR